MIEKSLQQVSRKKKPLAALLTFILGALGFGVCQQLKDPLQRQICEGSIQAGQEMVEDEYGETQSIRSVRR